MALKLTVPFSEKNEAKGRGAFWSVDDKIWFAPANQDYNQFTQWANVEQANLILQSPYFVAQNAVRCWKCSGTTGVVALATANNYYFLDYEEMDAEIETGPELDGIDAPDGKKIWFKEQGFSFVSYVSAMDEVSAARLATAYPLFYLDYSKASDGSYWMNHCQHCMAIQGDFFLHDSPGGAFCPTTAKQCQQLTLVSQDVKYDCVLNGGRNWSSIDEQIPVWATVKMGKSGLASR